MRPSFTLHNLITFSKLRKCARLRKMVFTSVCNFIRSRGPDEFWRKRKIFKLAAAYVGRRRNCYSITIKNVHRALVYATVGRKLKKQDFANLWTTRIIAGCEQHNVNYDVFKESLTRSNIFLNRKTLADLACWEPFSFKALTDIARERALREGITPPVQNKTLFVAKRGSQKKT